MVASCACCDCGCCGCGGRGFCFGWLRGDGCAGMRGEEVMNEGVFA